MSGIKGNIFYFFACRYMALTELFDRGLTDKRSKWDKTEAFVDRPLYRRWSNEYSLTVKRDITERIGGSWKPIKNEIIKNNNYTAQMWINEYKRLIAEDMLQEDKEV